MKKRTILTIFSVLALSLGVVGIVYAQRSPVKLGDIFNETVSDLDDEYYCDSEAEHPALLKLAGEYGVEYASLERYFCEDGFGVGEIEHALATSGLEEVDKSYEELLSMAIGGMDWGEIWQELGLIGMNPMDEIDDMDDMDEMDPEDEDIEDENGDKAMSAVCSGEMDHPVLLYLAEEYAADYETLKGYFCEDKFGIGELKNALQKSGDVDQDWEEILDMREDEGGKTGWGVIWQALHLIGKDKQQAPDQSLENQGDGFNKNFDHHPGKGKGLDK